MVEGKGFYLSTSRNSADFAGVALPQTAQDGPRERFRVNRRQRFPTSEATSDAVKPTASRWFKSGACNHRYRLNRTRFSWTRV